MCKRPNTSYSWATKNTRPKVSSIEGDRSRLNGLLAVDIVTGENYFSLTQSAKTEDIAEYFFRLLIDLKIKNPYNSNKKVKKLIITLDNNSTHKQKMRRILKQKIRDYELEQRLQGVEIEEAKLPEIYFEYTSPYSPDYNLAEYAIRITRQKCLHHLPSRDSLEEIAVRLGYMINTEGLMSKDQVANTIEHILVLGVRRGEAFLKIITTKL